MNERIKQVRLKFDLTQSEFGERIGITKSSVSTIESGKSNPSDQTIRSICREFSVNESWLRTGEGEPFSPPDRKEALEALINERFSNRPPEFRRDLVQVLLRFDPEKPEWAILEAIVHQLVLQAGMEETEKEAPDA